MQHYNKIYQSRYDETRCQFDFGFKPQDAALSLNNKAGDSGNPIAVAYRNTPHYLPWERFLAVGIRNLFDTIYFSGGSVPMSIRLQGEPQQFYGLKADGKIGVDVLYDGAAFASIEHITLALEHLAEIHFERYKENAEQVVRAYLFNLQKNLGVHLGNPSITINGLGPWTKGGPEVDEGNREAKPYRDGFGTYGTMEDSFSGEDPSKPSGTGTFLARYIAVQVVGNGLADFARVALRYIIGQEEVGLNITTNGTGKLSQEELQAWVRKNIPLGIRDTIERFNLRDPALYRQIVDDSDFFHNPDLPWNKFEITYR